MVNRITIEEIRENDAREQKEYSKQMVAKRPDILNLLYGEIRKNEDIFTTPKFDKNYFVTLWGIRRPGARKCLTYAWVSNLDLAVT